MDDDMMMASSPYALTTEIHDGVAVITFDLPGEPVNKISRSVKNEIIDVFGRLERDSNVKAVVLISGKPDNFIAGADIEEFLQIKSAADAERLSRDGQALIDSIERLRKPVIAAIHGACLGGGLETVLACDYRIATDHPKTILALPEVQLGIIPGAGGTQRLPRLIGVRAALDMIVAGKNIRAKKALQIGLVDEMIHPAILRSIAIQRARELSAKKLKHVNKAGGIPGLLLDKNPIGRRLVFKKAREAALQKTRGHYPAPLAAIDAVEAGYEYGMSYGYVEEAKLFGQMADTEISRQLIFLFFASTALKKDTGINNPSIQPLPVNKVGIIGSGFMGAGIASIAVQQGTLVRMKDADHGRVAKGFAAVNEIIKERLTKKQITKTQYSDYMSLLGGTTSYSGFRTAGIIIEAVFEDINVKHQVLQEAEQVIKPSAIFATNTSTIPITRIAEASRRPERVIGMHFFSPVQKMPLLEVITSPQTSDEVTATVVAYGKKLGKTVIVVNDGPGFYANRILFPYMNEAGRLLDQGVAIEDIDKALTDFGFPVGPITLMDEVGLDVGAKAAKIMHEALGERFEPANSLGTVVKLGRLGRKAKKGFYLYEKDGKKGEVDTTVYKDLGLGAQRTQITKEEIQQRTVLAMVNEAVRCLEDNILRSTRDGDIGAVYGIGFPPFRGGPFRYIDTLGPDTAVQQLEELNDRFPGRFEPANLLLDMARSGRKFY